MLFFSFFFLSDKLNSISGYHCDYVTLSRLCQQQKEVLDLRAIFRSLAEVPDQREASVRLTVNGKLEVNVLKMPQFLNLRHEQRGVTSLD